MKTVILLLIAIPVLFVLVIYTASEFGGEVVQVRTFDAEGRAYETPLWIVDTAGVAWLRSGDDGSSWYVRLRERPEIELEREGRTARYRALPFKDKAADIDALMARKYGLADRVIGIIRDPSRSVAIRLEPVGP